MKPGEPFNPWRGTCGFYAPDVISRLGAVGVLQTRRKLSHAHLGSAGFPIDRVTVVNKLQRRGQLERDRSLRHWGNTPFFVNESSKNRQFDERRTVYARFSDGFLTIRARFFEGRKLA